jgi:hypothetical protein
MKCRSSKAEIHGLLEGRVKELNKPANKKRNSAFLEAQQRITSNLICET